MALALLFPRFDHPAIEERYASWQSQMRLASANGVGEVDLYDEDESAAGVVRDLDASHVLVVTDPLVVATAATAVRLLAALESSGATAALPITNEATHPGQRGSAATPYLTLRELEVAAEAAARAPAIPERLVWDDSNPTAYVCSTETLRNEKRRLARALSGREVAIDRTTYVHTWSPMRAQVRSDLLPFIPETARSMIELGCGEGALGALVKQRQRCRVVGVEMDREASAIARRKLDDVYTGDARHIVSILDERFDCIVASELVEHVDDPWLLVGELRRLSASGGSLVISIPNVANASLIADLLHGRFDYGYTGLTCAGHLRFFTRRSIEELLRIGGWSVESIVPQHAAVTPSGEALLAAVRPSMPAIDESDLLATGYYVVARNLPQ